MFSASGLFGAKLTKLPPLFAKNEKLSFNIDTYFFHNVAITASFNRSTGNWR
jgi:hypothetical protein